MAVIEIARIQVRRGQENVTGVPQLEPGEFGWAEDTQHLYIGKRISEGANNDENSRILTDLDLRDILDLITGSGTSAVASTSTYRYRDNLSYDYFRSTTTTIARKLDANVNLTDFSQLTVHGDITQLLKTAISDIYANDYYGTDTVRVLELPAGQFVVSGVVDLPPLTSLVGQGEGITTLVLDSAGTSMFRTVDKFGAHYEQGMQIDGNSSKNVSVSNMTLAYSGNYNNNYPLISLDNTENPKISKVEFTTINTTTGFISSGLGIEARGNVGVDESTIICRDIGITECTFSVINSAIKEVGSISRVVINDNVFSNLNNAIIVTTGTGSAIPTDTIVSKNKFKFVYNEAINVTTSTNSSRVISADNTYFYVGNHSAQPEADVTSARAPIMTFNAPGNISINDHFYRSDVATSTGTFYCNPIANANVKIINNRPQRYKLAANIINQTVLKIPLTGHDQLITIDYQLSNELLSRKGKLTLNITADGYSSVSDYYNFSEMETDISTKVIFSTNDSESVNRNYISLTCSNFVPHETDIEYTLDITV